MKIPEHIQERIDLGNQQKLIGEYRQATRLYLEVLEYAFRESNEHIKMVSLSLLGNLLAFTQRPELAIEYHLYQLNIARRTNSRQGEALAKYDLGYTYLILENYNDAKDYLLQSLDIVSQISSSSLDHSHIQVKALNCLGKLSLERNELNEASQFYRESLKISSEKQINLEFIDAFIALARIEREIRVSKQTQVNLSGFNFIIEQLNEALFRSRDFQNHYSEVVALLELAETYRTIREIDIAKRKCEQALETVHKYNLPLASQCNMTLSKCERQANNQSAHISIREQAWYTERLPEMESLDKKKLEDFKRSVDIDIVIITATNKELISVVNKLNFNPQYGKHLKTYLSSGTYYYGQISSLNIIVTKCRMGSLRTDASAFATYDALKEWEPKAVIMVGIAFGRSQYEQKIGDVLVASEIIFYEQIRHSKNRDLSRAIIPPTSEILFNRFDNAHDWVFQRPDGTLCKVISGPILSGEKLIDNVEEKGKLFEAYPHAVGGEMEGTGLCAAARKTNTPWILIKSICDWGDGTKDKIHQPFAAAAAADLVSYILSQPNVLDTIC